MVCCGDNVFDVGELGYEFDVRSGFDGVDVLVGGFINDGGLQFGIDLFGCILQCQNAKCGDDGCGGSCGICFNGMVCSLDGICISSCQFDCVGKQCGDDGCGGNCGVCPVGQECVNLGFCIMLCQ